MKKLLLLAILMFGLDTYAQSTIYITNNTASPCMVYVTATGLRRPDCTDAIYTTFTLGVGQSISLSAFTDLPGPWYQGGTPNSYTSSQAQSFYVQPNWDYVRYHSLDDRSCDSPALQCGAGVGDREDCGGAVYEYPDDPCCPLEATWTDFGTYAIVNMFE